MCVFVTAAATPLPLHRYSPYNTCQYNFFAEYGSTSVFWTMRLGYSDINMSTGPGIFIKIKKVHGELINIGSCRGPPAMPSRTTRSMVLHLLLHISVSYRFLFTLYDDQVRSAARR